MLKCFKNIRLRPLLIHIMITLAYPALKAWISEYNRLQIFSDAMTIIALLLLILGIFYALFLHGDFDITQFVMKRGTHKGVMESFATYLEDRAQKREEAFNYPLFLGIIYLLAAAVIAYGIL